MQRKGGILYLESLVRVGVAGSREALNIMCLYYRWSLLRVNQQHVNVPLLLTIFIIPSRPPLRVRYSPRRTASGDVRWLRTRRLRCPDACMRRTALRRSEFRPVTAQSRWLVGLAHCLLSQGRNCRHFNPANNLRATTPSRVLPYNRSCAFRPVTAGWPAFSSHTGNCFFGLINSEISLRSST